MEELFSTISSLCSHFAESLNSVIVHPKTGHRLPSREDILTHSLSQAFHRLLPPECQVEEVCLKNVNGRRLHADGSIENLVRHARKGGFIIEIKCTPRKVETSGTCQASCAPLSTPMQSVVSPNLGTSDPTRDTLRALYDAEKSMSFVALKWFRDRYLPRKNFTWTRSEHSRQLAITHAIKQRLILTGKEPNPEFPAHPVTSIRLNRTLAQVKHLLEG